MMDLDGIAERIEKRTDGDLSQYGIEVRSIVIKKINPKNRSGHALERRGSLLAVQCPYCHGVYEVETAWGISSILIWFNINNKPYRRYLRTLPAGEWR